jgi:hypothetical protein
VNPVPRFRRRCRDCKRWLVGEYAARGVGPTCGGRIKRSRKPARVELHPGGSAVEVAAGQLPLFELAGAA